VDGRIQDFLPQFLAFKGDSADVLHAVLVHFTAAGTLQEGNILLNLPLDVALRLFRVFGVAEGRVENKQGNVEIARLHLVPFQHGPADVVAAHQHVRFGQPSDRTAVNRRAGDVGTGIGTQIVGIAHRFGFLAQIDAHLAGADHGSVILRIDGNHIHGDQRLHRPAARDPGHLLVVLPGHFGVDIIGRHDIPHFLFGFDFPFFLIRVYFGHDISFHTISRNASKRVFSCPSPGRGSSISKSRTGIPASSMLFRMSG